MKYHSYIIALKHNREPELRPEYVRKMKRIQKEPILRIGTVKDFKKRYSSKENQNKG